jgi:hypothetical protein
MSFTEVSWSNGDYITEVKLDQMIENDLYVREKAAYKYIANDSADKEVERSGGAFSTVSISVGGTISGTDITSTGSHVEEIDISSLTDDNIYTVSLTITGATVDTKAFRFYKTEDLSYLTVWVFTSTRTSGPDTFDKMSSVSIIGHRQAKSWTA